MRRIAPLAAALLLLPLCAAAQPMTTTPPEPAQPLPGVERIEGSDPALMPENADRTSGGAAAPPVILGPRVSSTPDSPATGGKVIQLPGAAPAPPAAATPGAAPPADPLLADPLLADPTLAEPPPAQAPVILRPGSSAAPARP